MIIADESLFLKRTSQMARDHKKRAARDFQQLGYTLEELRQKARVASNCPYCIGCLTTESFSLDHRKPVARGGAWTMANLEVCCLRCNECKGSLDHEEFRALMTAILGMSPQAQQSVLARLRAGAVRIYAKRKK